MTLCVCIWLFVSLYIHTLIGNVWYCYLCICIFGVLCWVTQSCRTLCDPMDWSLPGSSVPGDSLGRNTKSGCHALPPADLPNPGIKSRAPALQVDSLLSEPPGKPMNTGVSRSSLLQGIFSTQESNQGLLYCRWILYQLSYQRSSSDASIYCYLLKCKFSKEMDFALSAAVCPALRIVLSYSRCQINICWKN